METMPIFGRDYKNQCPSNCNFAAESATKHCHFKCVDQNHCGADDTVKDATIADKHLKVCRRCEVEGCYRCVSGKKGEQRETCEKCMPGYYLAEEGKECRSWTIWFFLAILVMLIVGIIVFLVWYLELLSRPVVNEEGLKYALECRARSKVRQPRDTEPSPNPADGIGPGLLYPFDTNLCRNNVAGPGNMFFFRYQVATLVWAIVLLSAWCVLVLAYDPNLFKLGLRKATTPQMMCYVVNWGRHLQMKYRWVKVYWLIFAYLFSLIGAIWYAVKSHRLFQELDNEHTTMADFVAICRSVPIMKGDTKVEDCIKECIEKETGEKVVGVSVCWNFHDKVREVKEALEGDVGSLEHAAAMNARRGEGPPPTQEHEDHAEEVQPAGCLKGCMDKINNSTLQKWHCHFHEHAEEETEEAKAERIAEMLRGLETTECAFAVFHDEDSRDRALACVKDKPIALGDNGFFLEPEIHEPESCCWQEFAVSEEKLCCNLCWGVVYMFLSLAAWTLILYAPYAHYMASFSFANGDEPGEMSEMLFVTLVVGAQFGLFIAANMISHHAGYRFEDEKQNCYIILYNAALILNLAMDMTLAAYLAYQQMSGRGVRVADGRLLSDLKTLEEILESFPMQKAIGNNLFKYCWPATFFIPFFCEPFGCQIGPYHIGCLMIRSNKKLVGENAEKCLELTEPEQGRYADVVFNAILVCAIPFIAGGYMLSTFGAFILSHCYIYYYDHWRVLRCNTRFWFASDVVSKFGQKLFSIPVAILGAALVFRANVASAPAHKDAEGHLEVKLGTGVLKGAALWGTMTGVIFGHMLVHYLLLEFLVPWLGETNILNAKETYEECARLKPCSWFSSNPIHCLRSKYIWKDDPPQTFYVIGKEHLMTRKDKIHSYFEQGKSMEAAEAAIQSNVKSGMTIAEDGWGSQGL
jgi:hypothetical protein